MHINENTRISELIRFNPGSIDAIASIAKVFEKLKIPVLRRALASRVTIKQAAKIGHSEIQDFYDKLIPLGFSTGIEAIEEETTLKDVPAFYRNLNSLKVMELDVRKTLKQGNDPFNEIMDAVKTLQDDFTLKVINSFEPIPLINILVKKGYQYYVEEINLSLYFTYFKKEGLSPEASESFPLINRENEISRILEKYGNNVKKIDVRQMEMPLPMVTILKELENLPEGTLFYVHHKRVPKFLLPELAERGYSWHIHEFEEGNVELFIFR